MSAALRTTQATPSMRPLGAAFGGIVIAVGDPRRAGLRPGGADHVQAVPAAGAAPVLNDRGWATAPSAADTAPVLNDRGWATAPSAADTAPVLNDRGWATAPSAADTAPVLNDRGWATAPSAASTPSAAFGHSRFGGSGGPNGTRIAR